MHGLCLPGNEANFMPQRQASLRRLLSLRELPKDTDLLRTAWVIQQLLGLSLAACHSLILAVPSRSTHMFPLQDPHFPSVTPAQCWGGLCHSQNRSFKWAFLTVGRKIKARGGKEFSPSSCSSLREIKLKVSSTAPCILLFFLRSAAK